MTDDFVGPKVNPPGGDKGDVRVSEDGQSWVVEGISGVTLTANRAAVINASGVIEASTTTKDQVGYLSTTTSDVQTQISARALKCVINVYESSDTWSKPAGALWVEVMTISGGGGGASGTKQASGTATSGGGGGGGGSISFNAIAASLLPDSVSVTVGAGGSGGAKVTTDSTAANAGTSSGATFFDRWCRSGGATFGGSYTTGNGAAGNGGAGMFAGGNGRAGTVGAAGNPASSASIQGCMGGSSGGGVVAAGPAATNGGASGSMPGLNYATLSAQAGNGLDGVSGGYRASGQAGGGGGSSVSGNAGDAGISATYGAGGSGGGSSINGANRDSGRGGDGAAGCVVVVTYF